LRAIRSALALSQPRAATAEPLEKRQHLTATPYSRASLAKFDSTLTYAYQNYVQSADASSATIELEAYANVGYRKQLQAALKHLQGQNISTNGRAVDARVPLSELGRLASVKSLKFAAAPSGVVNTGSVTSQGDAADIAAAARAAYNLSGSGVTVGILSDSFNNNINKSITDTYSTDITTGDLPANVQILSDNVPATDEGRALAQLIYDSAPGATIKFATALPGPATMASNIIALANAGCKLIVDDYTYINEPMFEDGVVAQAVETVIARGVTFISAAGNLNGQQSYGSAWRAGNTYTTGTINRDPAATNAPSTVYSGTSFNYNTSGQPADMQSFQLGPGQGVNLTLQWDSPYNSANSSSGATTQVDVYILNSDGSMIEGGSAALVTGKDPIQQVQFSNPSATTTNTYQLLIVNESSTSPDYIKYIDFTGQATGWTYTASGTNASTIFGHANAAGVITVGAVNYASTPAFGVSPPVLESFSGTGGTPIYYNTSNGFLGSPTLRQEPVVDGPDNVANTFFGTKKGSSFSFSGTSAGAGSVAGVVALLLSANPSLSPAQVASALQNTAINIGSAPNYQAGYGLVQAAPAIASVVGNVSGTVFSDNNFDSQLTAGEPGIAGATVYIDLNNNGKLDAGEPFTTTAANGAFTLYNQATGSNIILREVQPSGYVSTLSAQSISIAAGVTTANINLGAFPYNYAANSASYTVQLNASSPSQVNIFVGSTLAYSAPLASIPSLGFNLTGGSSSLTVNYASGVPIPTGGLNYTASGTANSLTINGSAAVDTVSVKNQATTFDSSIITASGIQNQIINGLGGNDNFSVIGAQPAAEALTFNGGSGNDSLTVNDPLPNNGIGTTFNAGTGATDRHTLNVNAGVFTFSGDPAVQSSNLTVNVGSTLGINSSGVVVTLTGKVVFAAGGGTGINSRNLAALNLSSGAIAQLAAPAAHASRAVLVTSTLSVATTAILDLNENDLIVNSGSFAAINPLLVSGYKSGAWTGNGIQSSAAAANSTRLTALGIYQNNTSGQALYTASNPFDGITPSAAAILIKYTYYGDTNLDGKVDGTDYSRIDNGYLNHLSNWANGDFNYDNSLDGSDYTLIDNAYNMQGINL
jgi:hypothetical protein